MLLKINGRTKFFERLTAVEKLRPGLYRVFTTIGGGNGRVFHVEGGRHAGGRRTDWFLDGFGDGTKTINCKSLMDALRCIETA